MPPLYYPLNRRRKRLSRKQLRIRAVYEAIYRNTAKGKGVSILQLAAQQHVTPATIRKYIENIRKLLRKNKNIRIETLDGKLYYVNLDIKEAAVRRHTVPTHGDAELHAYLNYSGIDARNKIDIDIVKVVPNSQQAIMTAVEEIRKLVERRFNSTKLASMLKYGRSPITPQSSNHFLYRHGLGEWFEF